MKLTPQLSEKIETAFKKIDKDDSGEVDTKEVLGIFSRFSGPAANKLLDDMDTNSDSKFVICSTQCH